MKKYFSILILCSFYFSSVASAQECASGFGELTEQKLHAIVANICALDTVSEREQIPYGKSEGGTFQHRWQILEKLDSFEVRGVCSQQMDFIQNKLTQGHDLKIVISKNTFRSKLNPIFTGALGRVQVRLQFKDNSFYDPGCDENSGIVRLRTLENIEVGVGLWDILKRGRTTLKTYSIEQKWESLSSSPVQIDFRAPQFNARQNRLVTSLDSAANILVKVGLYLFKEEGSPEFTYEYPRANHVFLNEGTEFRGCSVVKNNSELSIPEMVSVGECRKLLAFL